MDRSGPVTTLSGSWPETCAHTTGDDAVRQRVEAIANDSVRQEVYAVAHEGYEQIPGVIVRRMFPELSDVLDVEIGRIDAFVAHQNQTCLKRALAVHPTATSIRDAQVQEGGWRWVDGVIQGRGAQTFRVMASLFEAHELSDVIPVAEAVIGDLAISSDGWVAIPPQGLRAVFADRTLAQVEAVRRAVQQAGTLDPGALVRREYFGELTSVSRHLLEEAARWAGRDPVFSNAVIHYLASELAERALFEQLTSLHEALEIVAQSQPARTYGWVKQHIAEAQEQAQDDVKQFRDSRKRAREWLEPLLVSFASRSGE